MASIKTEAAAPEQPKVAQAPSNPNLDMLQGMLNMVVRVPTVVPEDIALTILCSY